MKYLTERQRDILNFIRSFQKERGVAPTHREICDHFCFYSYGKVYKHLSLLEKKGLISRVPDPDHGRILRTLLTPSGQDVLEACDRVAQQVEAKMLEDLRPEERVALHAGLKSCVRNLGAGF